MDTKIVYTYRQRIWGARQTFRELFEYYRFTKKQKQLLFTLTTFNPTPTSKLQEKTRSKSVKSLIRDTNKRLKGNHLDDKIRIVSCFKSSGLKSYYRLIFKPFVTE